VNYQVGDIVVIENEAGEEEMGKVVHKGCGRYVVEFIRGKLDGESVVVELDGGGNKFLFSSS
jgi:hypothetical protein